MTHAIAALLVAAAGLADVPAADAPAFKVCMISGSEEYGSDASLEALKADLEAHDPSIRCTIVRAKNEQERDLEGLEALDDCHVALVFTRRLRIEGPALEKIKAYVASKRPIVGVRTASHGFQNWLDFDRLVLGGNYKGHYGKDTSQRAIPEPSAASHPVLKGVGTIASRASLYKTGPIADDCTLLMTASSPEGREPAAWVNERDGRRVFYTALGGQGDFENDTFKRLLANAIYWTARREVVRRPAPAPSPRVAASGMIRLKLRSRQATIAGAGEAVASEVVRDVPAAETAIVICDMWDLHWCRGASERCGKIAEAMEPVVGAAREKGVLVIHAPSECMGFYADRPQRLRAILAPKATPPPAGSAKTEPPLPIDDSDGGCDTDDAMYLAWTRQHPALSIHEADAISDSGDEIYNLLRQHGIKTLLVMGVHTNMCVLNRTFAIKAMTRRGIDCVLVRDLTDTMYDPRDRPHVPHDRGTDLVVEHIETHWCPSMRSADLVDGLPR